MVATPTPSKSERQRVCENPEYQGVYGRVGNFVRQGTKPEALNCFVVGQFPVQVRRTCKGEIE